MRSLTEIVSESFIWGVGITRPKPGQERRAAVYITVTLMLVVLTTVGIFLLFIGRL